MVQLVSSGVPQQHLEQDNTVTSSVARESNVGVFEGEDKASKSTIMSSSISDVHEDDFKEVIDLLEEKINEKEESTTRSGLLGELGTKGCQQQGSAAHSVEYWTVGSKGKPKTFLRRYSVNRPTRRQLVRGRQGRTDVPATWDNGTFNQNFLGGMLSPLLPQFSGANFVPPQQLPPLASSHFHQAQTPLQFYTPPASATFPPQPFATSTIQVFIPPEQSFSNPPQPTVTTSQFTPMPPMNTLLPASLFPLPQPPPYIQYYAPAAPTFPQTSPGASYFQGAPLFYQVPPASIPATIQADHTFFNNYNYAGGYGSSHNYPPPSYDDAILTTPSSVTPIYVSTNEGSSTEVQLMGEMEVDSTTNDNNETSTHPENSEHSQNNFTTPTVSPIVTPSTSETSLSDISHVGLLDELVGTTSGYSSCSSSSSPLATSTPSLDGTHRETLVDTNIASDEGISTVPQEQLSGSSETVPTTMDPGLRGFSIELNDFNNACMNTHFQGTNVWTQSLVSLQSVPSQPQQNLLVYPGDSSILIFSLNDGNRTAIMYNMQELPYVANLFDFEVQTSFKEQCVPSLIYGYYVPPRTEDDDFFGGQLPVWQMKMVQYFLKYKQDSWKMHGVPEVFNVEYWIGKLMSVIGEFHIVSKLRFCCRTCKVPWTSKKGTIVFRFCYNSTFRQGWILMRIFGQICMRQECCDWTFQNPACYPEEIDRAMKKLSEYIGNQCYGIAVKPNCFDECFKSIRKSGNVGSNNSVGKEREKSNISPTPHKKEFCQACMNGVCKNLFAKPFVAPSKSIPH